MQAQDAGSRRPRPGPLGRLVLLVLFIALASVVAFVLPTPTVAEIRTMLDGLGWWGVAAFVLGYAALTLAPVPKSVLSIAAGVLFGFSGGLLVVYAAAMLGATAAFWLGRVLGREAVERFTGTRVGKVDEVLRRRGFVAVVGVRLVPVLPFTAINYSAGLTSVGWWPYFFGTMLGIVPGALSFVALGAYGLELEWPALVALGVLGVLTLAGAVVAVRIRHRGESTGA
jgi:uncharacterized membrane protein YdjX (TVP38/TMEM64 family)